MLFIYNGILFSNKKNEILSFAGKWLELENIIFNEVSQFRRPKAAGFLSYVEYRPNTNTRNIIKNSPR
jgi:hypothetical protein